MLWSAPTTAQYLYSNWQRQSAHKQTGIGSLETQEPTRRGRAHAHHLHASALETEIDSLMIRFHTQQLIHIHNPECPALSRRQQVYSTVRLDEYSQPA